ncbi:MAG: DUF3786 domain-containing protein [bacterium]|nr:DUF3786 domain-containing protein [bacterium]
MRIENSHFLRWGAARGDPGALIGRVREMRGALAGVDPAAVAARSGAAHTAGGGLLLDVWGRRLAVDLPGFVARDAASGREADPGTQALVAYYLFTSDGTPLAGRWISFAELRDGTFYERAFRGYTGGALVRARGGDPAPIAAAAERLGGRREAAGDLAYSFRPLPRLPLLLVWWRGDEEFPPSASILFDASANHYLPTDVCAVLGATLARRLLRSG